MDKFTDRVALITGAGQGIGREVARAFASLGITTAVNDINPLNLDETVGQIRQAGGNAKAYVFDIAKRMPIEGMVSQVMEHFGRIDILVNHASVRPDAALLEMDEWEFHRTMDVNLGGPFFTMQLVGRVMQQQGGGTIINLISSAQTGKFIKGRSAYSSSQAGLLGLTLSAAPELAPFHIRVNAVCRGSIQQGIAPSANLDRSVLRMWQEAHPQLWLGDYPELVSSVAYLCSQEASSVTGQVFIGDLGS